MGTSRELRRVKGWEGGLEGLNLTVQRDEQEKFPLLQSVFSAKVVSCYI